MELGVKAVVGGIALFVLGGLSVYFLTKPEAGTLPSEAAPTTETIISATPSTSTAESTSSIINTESFYAAADARREQLLIEKEEADRLAKLKATKERSVECKFWKLQNKTSSAAAKIEEKINEHCKFPTSSSESSSSSSPDENTGSSVAG